MQDQPATLGQTKVRPPAIALKRRLGSSGAFVRASSAGRKALAEAGTEFVVLENRCEQVPRGAVEGMPAQGGTEGLSRTRGVSRAQCTMGGCKALG